MKIKTIYFVVSLPIIFVFFLVTILFLGLNKSEDLPSAIIGKEAPILSLTAYENIPLITKKDLQSNNIKLVNFWASWCGPCRAEHPILDKISKSQIEIFGINYKDTVTNSERFLSSLGNPYSKIGRDEDGKTAIEWGLYGVPETFVISPKGVVLLRHPGPITQKVYIEKIKPLLKID